jgi:glycosyltransferase involved in cell wall biosynthesis
MTISLSVVMSVYNGAATVREAVESVLAQTYDDFEFIIVDDGSTDATPGILSSFHDSRVKVIRQENAGLTVSLNRGIGAATAPLIARMDADDISFPSRLETQVRILGSCPDIVLVGSDADLIDAGGKRVGSLRHLLRDDQIRRVYPVGNQFVHGSVIFRREAFERAGRYDEGLRYSQDFDLWWRMLETGEVLNLPETLYAQREWPQRISSNLRPEQDRDRDRIVRRMWREILDPEAEFPPLRSGKTARVPTAADPHAGERKLFYARLLLRMGTGFVLHGDFRRARAYFAESLTANPMAVETWGCLAGCSLLPSFLKRCCQGRAQRFALYATIASALESRE